MKFELTILGCGAATPTLRRNPTSQLLNMHDKFYLVDCAEGTQLQLRKLKFKFQRINHIFISHLHGDHYLGLPGLISSMNLLGRTKELHLYGPPELKELIELNLKYSDTFLNFDLHIHPIQYDETKMIWENQALEIYSFPLKHRIKCAGFLFREKPKKLRIIREKILSQELGVSEIVALKRGEKVVREDGVELDPADYTLPPYPSRSYAYCSDTAYYERIIETIKDVDLLYHEATFLNQHKQRAKETFHSTAEQAAQIAKQANVGQLVLGHYSSRYKDIEKFRKEANAQFQNVTLAYDGLKVTL